MADLAELCRKAALLGIGVYALSKEKIEEFAQEMVKKGELNQEEGKKFVLEVLSEKNRQCKEIEEKITSKVKDVVENSGVASKKDVEELSDKTDDLATRMERIETALDKLKNL